MRSAGALRIDHVMGLMRLYIIPDSGTAGTYLYFNFRDMLNIVALESHLNQCMIVGESIGNVPDGFIDTLRARNVYSLGVLWAERRFSQSAAISRICVYFNRYPRHGAVADVVVRI